MAVSHTVSSNSDVASAEVGSAAVRCCWQLVKADSVLVFRWVIAQQQQGLMLGLIFGLN